MLWFLFHFGVFFRFFLFLFVVVVCVCVCVCVCYWVWELFLVYFNSLFSVGDVCGRGGGVVGRGSVFSGVVVVVVVFCLVLFLGKFVCVCFIVK